MTPAGFGVESDVGFLVMSVWGMARSDDRNLTYHLL